MKLSQVFECMKVSYFSTIGRFIWILITLAAVCVCLCVQKNMASVAENNASTLGLSLDLDYRYQEAEKVFHSSQLFFLSLHKNI